MKGASTLRAMARTALLVLLLAVLALAAGRYLLRAPMLVDWHRDLVARLEVPVLLEIRVRLRFDTP